MSVMKIEIGPENTEAEEKLPPNQPDGSMIGVNYADAYIKAIKHRSDEVGRVKCKRKGIRLTLTVGDKEGSGLMRRFVHGPDPKTILSEALKEAADDAGVTLSVEEGVIFIET